MSIFLQNLAMIIWGSRPKPFPHGTLPPYFEKTAVTFEGRNLSFSEIDDRSNRLANALTDMGVRTKDNVATLMRNCLEYPEIEFALVKGGFCQITLNPRLTAAEQLLQIDETEAKAVIDALAENGLKRGDNDLKLIMMCELPSNAVLAACVGSLWLARRWLPAAALL